MKFYIYSKCSTCKDALNFLKKKSVPFVQKEITETPPTVEELKMMLAHQDGNLKKLFNTSGQLYREMQLTEKLKEMSELEALKLLSKHGMLIKRPFLLGEEVGLVGFNEASWEAALR